MSVRVAARDLGQVHQHAIRMIERHHPEAVKDLIREEFRPVLIAHYLSHREGYMMESIGRMLNKTIDEAARMARVGSRMVATGDPEDVKEYNRLEMRFASLVCQYTVGK